MNQNSMSSIDQRTQLAGSNRLELLLFKLQDGQTYGINVFKICRMNNIWFVNLAV